MKKLKLLVLLSLLFVCGCTNSGKTEIFGGDLVKNHVMYGSSSNAALAYELPVISTEKITEFSIDQFYVSGEGDYKIEFEELTGGSSYKNYYYYFAHISVAVSDESPADFSIESVDMCINGEVVNYKISEMIFTNTIAKYPQYKDDESDLVYTSDVTFLYQTIPDQAQQNIDLEAQSDCIIKEFGALDYLNTENLDIYVNNNKENLDKEIKLNKGDELRISFNLSYEKNIPEYSLLKTTRYITYLNNDGTKCVFADPQGFMIINYVNDNFIKQYIDNYIGDK